MHVQVAHHDIRQHDAGDSGVGMLEAQLKDAALRGDVDPESAIDREGGRHGHIPGRVGLGNDIGFPDRSDDLLGEVEAREGPHFKLESVPSGAARGRDGVDGAVRTDGSAIYDVFDQELGFLIHTLVWSTGRPRPLRRYPVATGR